jgi:hypothetical protein
VCISSAAAVVASDPDSDAAAPASNSDAPTTTEDKREPRRSPHWQSVVAPESNLNAGDSDSEGAVDVRCRRSVWTLLRDYRMLAHDDGDGRPLRYMSLYGGVVTNML